MTDRIPGSSWSNPIWHGKWRIYVGGEMPGENYAFVHDDYDGADVAFDVASRDDRYGYARTIEEAKAEIDEREADAASNPAAERTKADSQALNSIEQPHQSKIPTQPQGEGDQSP